MIESVRRLIARWRLRLLLWLAKRCGLVLMRGEYVRKSVYFMDGVHLMCSRSGYLRDGRYPGGRHAERKLRQEVLAAREALRSATFNLGERI